MKRKPYAYTGSYDDSDDRMYAINCKDRNQALEEMIKEFDEKDIYIKPVFSPENIENDNFHFCGKCETFEPDNVCSECERNLQGRLHTIYSIKLELK